MQNNISEGINMGWVCLVCSKDADFIVDVPTSKANKQGRYSIQRRGFCKAHKPNIWTIKEYNKAMNDARDKDGKKDTNC